MNRYTKVFPLRQNINLTGGLNDESGQKGPKK